MSYMIHVLCSMMGCAILEYVQLNTNTVMCVKSIYHLASYIYIDFLHPLRRVTRERNMYVQSLKDGTGGLRSQSYKHRSLGLNRRGLNSNVHQTGN